MRLRRRSFRFGRDDKKENGMGISKMKNSVRLIFRLVAVSATSIDVTPYYGDRLFRLSSEPMRFPPLEVIGSSP